MSSLSPIPYKIRNKKGGGKWGASPLPPVPTPPLQTGPPGSAGEKLQSLKSTEALSGQAPGPRPRPEAAAGGTRQPGAQPYSVSY